MPIGLITDTAYCVRLGDSEVNRARTRFANLDKVLWILLTLTKAASLPQTEPKHFATYE